MDTKDQTGNSKQISIVYAKPQEDEGRVGAPVDSQKESLYYVSADRQDPHGQKDDEGWEDNVAYSSYSADNVQSKWKGENKDGGETEGWKDNSLYATKEID